jgi:hypothetical protein
MDIALYLGRFGNRDDAEKKVPVKGGGIFREWPKKVKVFKKLRRIEKLEAKDDGVLTDKEKKRLSKLAKIKSKLDKIDQKVMRKYGPEAVTTMPLGQLYESCDDKVSLALEYIQLVRQYPTTLRTVIFHTRRILKIDLTTYQLMEECLSCKSVDAVESLVRRIQGYHLDPSSFSYDVEKAKKEKEALQKKEQEEGKRKRYEARMIRKAKREGKADLEFYLRRGAVVPTLETIKELKKLGKEDQMKLWKEREHSQHCLSFHLTEGECPRGRGCAFLHATSKTSTTFNETDEVAG